MHCGILIIGSLLWDDGNKCQRANWRKERLDVSAAVRARTPIYYGRKSRSRGDTYTMAFRPNGPMGHAVLVPCTGKIEGIDSLIAEASALWQAECPDAKAQPGTLGKFWGCVGALFASGNAHAKLSAEWTAHFQKAETRSVSVVNANGLLDIGWPDGLDGQPAEFDVILATATKPEPEPPTPHAVANAWVDQCARHEKYFFNNVRHGIRTPEDADIWSRIEERSPPWINAEPYREAIETLREEAATRAQQS